MQLQYEATEKNPASHGYFEINISLILVSYFSMISIFGMAVFIKQIKVIFSQDVLYIM